MDSCQLRYGALAWPCHALCQAWQWHIEGSKQNGALMDLE